MDEILEDLKDHECLLADGFNEAIVGISLGANPRAIYDSRKCIRILVADEDMTEEDAIDYFYYNTVQAYMGDNTPIFINAYE
jgi:hypothetical protein